MPMANEPVLIQLAAKRPQSRLRGGSAIRQALLLQGRVPA